MIRALLLTYFLLTVGVSLSLAQSDPTLKWASPFTVLAATEIINDAIETGVTGNVGVYPGDRIAGEERLVILKGRAEKGTTAADAAQRDAKAAYNNLLALGQGNDVKELSPVIGTGTTLTPGVHKINSGLTLQGVLTLNGLGDDNAVFIIIVDGNLLSESSNAGVLPENRAQSKNLYWVVSGEVNLGGITGMKGNILANNDINMNGVVVEGRAISLNGKVVFNGPRNNLYLPQTVNPNLSITKTAPEKEYRVGDRITYTIAVTNAGPGSATNVVVTENFPSNLRYVPGSAVYDNTKGVFDGSTFTWRLPFVQFGESHQIQLTFDIVSPGQIANNVTVKSGETKESDPPIDDDVVIEVPGSNLSVTKVATGAPYLVGGNVTYTITVSNTGVYDAKNISVTEQLPAGLEFVSASATLGSYNSTTGIYTVGDLAVGASATLTLVAKIKAPGKILNTATVNVPPTSNVPDLTPGDNTGGEEIDVTCAPLPTLAITGALDAYLCEGATSAVLTATPIPGATYTFTVTGGLTKVSQSGNTVTVNAGATSGTVQVSVTDLCNNTATVTKEFNIVKKLTTPVISGPATVCENSTGNSYSVADYGDGTEYTWTATGSLQITNGNNTPAVEVSAGALGGSLTLVVSNRCFTTAPVTKVISTTTLPNAPTAITGNTTVCVGNQVTYSTPALARSESYQWNVPTGWTVVSGQGERTITYTVGNTSGDVNLSVKATNVCGTTSAATIAVRVNEKPVAPAAITGAATVCAGTDVTYSVAAVPGATGYTWTPPVGWSVVSGAGTASVTFRVGQAGGTMTVTANNGCGSSAATTFAVTVNDKPATPGTIAGPASVCGKGAGNVYSIAAVDGATEYVWAVPEGWTIESGQGTTTITVTAGETAGTVKVKAKNACGDSGERTYNSTITPLPATPAAITGEATVCAGTEATYRVAAVSGATGYTWTLPAGWSIVSGEGSAQVTVQVGTAGGNVSVTADNNCGGSAAATKAVTVNDKLAAPAITGEAGACIGTNLTYSIPAVTGATGYAWTVPATWRLVSGQNTTSITVEVGAEAGQVTVGVVNGCGTGNAAALNVAPVLAPTETNYIVGNAAVCEYGETVTYKMATVEEGVTYTWSVPTGWTIVAGQGTGTITVNSTAMAGTISVVATNVCGTAQTVSKDIRITVPLSSVGAISDNSNVCDGLTYSIMALQGASSYLWTVPEGFTITSGQGTLSIKVKAESPTATGEVTVAALNGVNSSCVGAVTSAPVDASLADGQLNIPKAFSPNGDGKNDTWTVANLEKFATNEVIIFNRWGSEVYKAKNYQNNWSASKLEQGTYFYKVRVTVCDGVVKEFTGYTTLFR